MSQARRQGLKGRSWKKGHIKKLKEGYSFYEISQKRLYYREIDKERDLRIKKL